MAWSWAIVYLALNLKMQVTSMRKQSMLSHCFSSNFQQAFFPTNVAHAQAIKPTMVCHNHGLQQPVVFTVYHNHLHQPWCVTVMVYVSLPWCVITMACTNYGVILDHNVSPGFSVGGWPSCPTIINHHASMLKPTCMLTWWAIWFILISVMLLSPFGFRWSAMVACVAHSLTMIWTVYTYMKESYTKIYPPRPMPRTGWALIEHAAMSTTLAETRFTTTHAGEDGKQETRTTTWYYKKTLQHNTSVTTTSTHP